MEPLSWGPGISVPLLLAGEILCSLISRFRGDHYRSRLVDSMAFGSYNKEFEPGKTGREWLSADEGNVTRYEADPLCGFLFTVSGYRQMFRGMRTLTKKRRARDTERSAGVFCIRGKDP